MSAPNIYHDAVVAALIADGWTITDDPLTVTFGGRDMFVDLGAERNTLGAERAGVKIAVEIQSFLSRSPAYDLHAAVGQYSIYRAAMERTEPARTVFMAVPLRVYEDILSERFGRMVTESLQLHIVVFDHQRERIVKWIE